MTSNTAVSSNIRSAIARQRRTYKSVAQATDIDPRQFRRRCREEVEWTAAELGAVATALDVTSDSLLGIEGRTPWASEKATALPADIAALVAEVDIPAAFTEQANAVALAVYRGTMRKLLDAIANAEV